MAKKEVIIIANYSDAKLVSFNELCEACGISPEFLEELIAHDILAAQRGALEEWTFDTDTLQRVKTAIRLRRDLQIHDLEGIALVLELLDQLNDLRTKMDLLERHYIKHK